MRGIAAGQGQEGLRGTRRKGLSALLARGAMRVGIGVALCAAGSGPARAEGEAESAAPTSAAFSAEAREQPFGDRLQPRTVAARKRDELLQQVPGSVTTLPAETLVRSNLRRISDIQSATPNLVYDAFGNMGRIALRGIGQDQTVLVSGDTGVGVYVDGIFVARNGGQLPLPFDLERIDVLRGPQGTLFGTNSPGGAISVVTRKPDFDLGAEADVRVGNLSALESRLAVNVPLKPEAAALRVSVATATRDGYTKNVVDGSRLNDDKELSGRAQLLVLPQDDIELLFSAYYTQKNRTPPAQKCAISGPGTGTSGLLFRESGARAACLRDAARDAFDAASDTPFAQDHLALAGGTLSLTWDLTPELTLMSLTGFRSEESRPAFEGDATEVPLFGFTSDAGRGIQRQWSQEFQLLGQAFGGRLRYVGGLYGFTEDASQREFLALGFIPTAPLAARLQASGGGAELPPGVSPLALQSAASALFARPIARNPEQQQDLFKVDNLSYAAFGQATYGLTDRLDLTVGLRFTQERKRVFTRRQVAACDDTGDINPLLLAICRAGIGGAPTFDAAILSGFERSARFSRFSPQATLAYQASDDASVYVSYATGFRNGGFDIAAIRPEQTEKIDPEEITTYEVGFKSRWRDGRVLLNASAFYTRQEDVRVAIDLGNDSPSDGNVGDALLRGGELELVFLPTEHLGLSANLGALRARYDDLRPQFQFLSGERLALAPNYTMNFAADYRTPLGGLGTLGLRTSWTHHGVQQNDPAGTDATESGKYGLLDGRVSLALADGRTEIAAFASNLLDRRYFDNAKASVASGNAALFFGPPRLYGIELRRRF